MKNQNSLPQENLSSNDSKIKHSIDNMIIVTLLLIFGVGGFFLGRKSVSPEKDKEIPPGKANIRRITPTITNLPTMKATPEDNQNTGDKKRVNAPTCNLSVELPTQDSYTPVSFQHLIGTNLLQNFIDEEFKKPNKWSIQEEVNTNRATIANLHYDRRLNIVYLPGGLPIGVYPGPGYIKSPYFQVYCKVDQRTSDQITDDIQSILNAGDEFTPKFISKAKVDLWGEEVYEIKHTNAVEFPTGSFYIFTRDGFSYLVNVFGETRTFDEIFKSLRFGNEN